MKCAQTYSADATGTRLSRLFLKMSKPGVHVELLNSGRHEVAFYQAMRERPLSITIPRCYSAEVDPHTHQSHILMEDLSLSHFQKPLPIPPSNRHCEMIVESLANLHALWWNHPSLGNGLGERLTQEKAMMIRRRLENTLSPFLDFLGDAFMPQQRRTHLEKPLLQRYHHILAENGVSYSWEALWQDYREAVIVMTLIPIGQFRRGSPTGAIWFGLQDSMAAFHDLNCAEIL